MTPNCSKCVLCIKLVMHLYDGLDRNSVCLLCLYLQVLVLVGDQLDYSDDVCGVVLSVRFNEDILSVWNRNASDHQVCNST